jgi:hypothetical protein
MPDVFISYSVQDEQFARFVREHLAQEKLDVFLASISLEPGHKWTPQIFKALQNSEWVFFLASKNALASANVQQELGAALITQKKLVPIMWDIDPSYLPVWIAQYQGLCLKGQTIENIRDQIIALASKVRADKEKGMLIAGGLIAALFLLMSRS